ncbi:MAG: hypothetical protein ACKOFP_09955 [Actinomycetota bacterium]
MTEATLVLAQSAPVTQWPLRIALVALVFATIALVLLAMRRGWLARAGRQGDIPAPHSVAPETWAADGPAIPGLFIGSTVSGDWLDRVVVHDLGVRSRAELSMSTDGVLFGRTGAGDVFIPRRDLRGARADRGIAGKAYERDGVVVVTWQLGGRVIDSGFRADPSWGQAAALDGLLGLLADERTP